MAWKPLNNLNHRITIQEVDNIQNEWGDMEEVFIDVIECWAAMKSVKATDVKAAIGTITSESLVFLVRGDNQTIRKEVTNKNYVLFEGERYNISFILRADPTSGFFTELWAERVG